jgi:methylated-DNA-[protein]-cysteine S-methyltransferase
VPESIVHGSVPGPWGPIHVAASGSGIVAIDILAPPEEFLAELERRFGPRALSRGADDAANDAAIAHLRAGLAAVSAFLAGDRRAFDATTLDLSDRPAWDRAVLEAVQDVAWATTSSYGRIAAAIGRRGAARAVGGAVGRNPVSLAIPCHRIIAGNGTLGGYGGGWWGSRELRLDLKRDLLAREGTVVPNDAGAARPSTGDSRFVAQATPEGTGPR